MYTHVCLTSSTPKKQPIQLDLSLLKAAPGCRFSFSRQDPTVQQQIKDCDDLCCDRLSDLDEEFVESKNIGCSDGHLWILSGYHAYGITHLMRTYRYSKWGHECVVQQNFHAVSNSLLR